MKREKTNIRVRKLIKYFKNTTIDKIVKEIKNYGEML